MRSEEFFAICVLKHLLKLLHIEALGIPTNYEKLLFLYLLNLVCG